MRSPELNFDAEEHRYWLEYEDGTIEYIPSVSEILRPLEDYSAVNPDLLARACEYGTNVHKVIELWLKGSLDEDALDDGLKKPLAGFKKWFCPYLLFGSRFIAEERRYHPKLKYAGTVDLFIADKAIIDFKTRKFNPIVDPVRLAAYKAMYPEFPPLETHVLEIDVYGGCKLVNAYHRQAWGVFRLLLDKYNYNKKCDLKISQWKNR
ncbi:MAG: exonuclease [Podoviridae sp. cty5g4]|nr:MAG: exonuclease [Podoviridae sp. cty5g4]